MIFRFSSLVARHRGRILLTAIAAALVGVVGAVRSVEEPIGTVVAALGAAGTALMLAAIVSVAFRWRTGVGFDVDEERRAFRTPRSAAPVFLGLFALAGLVVLATVGGWAWAHGDRDGGWVGVMLLMGACAPGDRPASPPRHR